MEKELSKLIKTIKENNIKKGYITFTYYTRGNNNNWYCEYEYYDYTNYFTGWKKATGYGYDKESTCLSNAINEFKKLFIRYNKKAKKHSSYGLYEDNSISYGIGINAVINCLNCFKNVKITKEYNGKLENCLKIEISYNDFLKR